MCAGSKKHLSDGVLTREFVALVQRSRETTVELLVCMAEFDSRKLFAPAGYPSLFEYCVGKLRMSEDEAGTRILVARTARRFPILLEMLADGRLHLTAARLLAPHLTQENCKELLAGAVNRRAAVIRMTLVQRFGAPEPRTIVRPILGRPLALTAPQPLPDTSLGNGVAAVALPVSKQVGFELGAGGQPLPIEPTRSDETPPVDPLPPAPLRFELRCTLDERTHDLLRQAQALLSHSVPPGDVGQVLRRALEALVPQLEKQKLAVSDRPQQRPRATTSMRHIPAHVRRAVVKRDQGRCTFVGDEGHRCGESRFLELDHIVPVARGGEATLENLRLRCRTHNQLEADRTYGAGFMQAKRGGGRAEPGVGRVGTRRARMQGWWRRPPD